jgi:hypothetical protein
MPPADSFDEQDAANLAALHPDALLVRRASQRIQAPLCLLFGLHSAQFISHADRFAWWVRAGQGDDPSPLLLGESRLASRSWAIAEPIDAFAIEAHDPLSYRVGMAAQLLGDGHRTLPLPAPDNHPGADNPIAWRMATAGQFPNVARFLLITRCARKQELGHGDLL